MDGSHWCIQINGTIYQLGLDKDRDIKIRISSKNEKNALYERDCKRYTWYLIKIDLSYFDPEELRNYAKSFETSSKNQNTIGFYRLFFKKHIVK